MTSFVMGGGKDSARVLSARFLSFPAKGVSLETRKLGYARTQPPPEAGVIAAFVVEVGSISNETTENGDAGNSCDAG